MKTRWFTVLAVLAGATLLALLAGGALAATLFGTPIDVSGVAVQDINSVDFIESDIAIVPDNGAVYVVWEDNGGNPAASSYLYYSWSGDNGENWVKRTEFYTGSNSGDPSIAISGTNVYVAWVKDPVYTSSLVSQKELNSTDVYTVPKDLSDLIVSQPHLEVDDSNGEMHVVFQGITPAGEYRVYYSNRSPGSGWAEPTRVYTPSSDHLVVDPSLTLDSSGNLYVVLRDWDIFDPQSTLLYISATNASEVTWHSPVTVTSVVSDIALPDIALDEEDVIHVTWSLVEYEGSLAGGADYNEDRMYYAFSTDGGASWTRRVIDSKKVYGVTRADPYSPRPVIATLPVTGADEVYVVWEGERCDLGTCAQGYIFETVWLASSVNRGASWGIRQLSRMENNSAVRPVVAADGDRQTVHVAWSQQVSGSDYQEYYARGAPASVSVYLPIVLKKY